MEIFGSIKLRGSLADGTGDPILTKDASTQEVGTATATLGTLTDANIWVGNASDEPTAVTVSGDITLANDGTVAIATGVIVNADINASAAIAVSKLAALTASRAVVTDGSGFISAATTTSTQIGYLSTTTSDVQVQIDAKQATITGAATTVVSSDLSTNLAVISNGSGKLDVSAVTSTELGYLAGADSNIQDQLDTKFAATIASVAEGDILMYNGTNWVNLPRGTNGQALYSTATTVEWNTPTINGIPIGGTDGQVLTKQSGTDFDADWETLTTASITDITASASEINILDGITATTTELNYVDGVTSAIQTQLDDKLGKTLPQNSIFVGNSSNIATALAGGTNGYVLTSVSGVPTWAASSAGTPPGSDTQMIFNDAGSFGTDTGFTYNKTTDTLTVVNLDTATTVGGAYIHRVGGTDVALADGGTGASLADPGADRIMFWDDSAGAVAWLTVGTGLAITTTTISGVELIDDDTFATASATTAPSSESVKAYVDNNVTSNDTDIKYFEQNDFLVGTATVSGWSSSSSGAGAVFGITAPGYGVDTTENVVGLITQSTGTTTTGRCHIFKYGLQLGTHDTRFRFRSAIENLSDATDTYSTRIGISDLSNVATGDPDNGVFFRYTHSVNSGEYEAVCRAGGVETATDTNVAATTSYKVFEIRVNEAATSVTFYIDGVLVATISTNIPTGVDSNFYSHILKSAGTTSRNLHLDWTEITLTKTTAR